MGLFVELFLFPSVRASTKAAELRPSACEGVTGALKGKTVETLLVLFFYFYFFYFFFGWASGKDRIKLVLCRDVKEHTEPISYTACHSLVSPPPMWPGN